MKAKVEHVTGYPPPAPNAKKCSGRIWKATAEKLCFVFRNRSYIHEDLDINKGILPKQS